MSDARDFVVDKTDLRHTAFLPGQHTADTSLAAGGVLLRPDCFALTANNVTYAVVGDLMGYWNFYPASGSWGRIPVWGFADVVATRHPALAVGERVFGYWPISTYTMLEADHVTPEGFVEAAAHRAALPPFYNRYTRVAADPGYARTNEGAIAIFRPLFATGFLLDAFLAHERWFGAEQIVLSSASSKTALALAFLLSSGGRGARRVVGLTSPANAAFVRGTGYYDDVVPYDAVSHALADVPSVFVDFAGDPRVLTAVHQRLARTLAYSCQVGVTHWEGGLGVPEGLPGPAPILFFAPDHATARSAEWGAAEFAARLAGAMQRFLAAAEAWLEITVGRGPEAIETAYRGFLEGRANPAEGYVLGL